MNKEYFLRELAYLLQDLTEEEREDALQYYRDYFAEAGPEHEAEVLTRIGSPEKVAAELKSSLSGEEDGGEFTERGYYDERFDEHHQIPDHYAGLVEYTGGAGKTEQEKENGSAGANRRSWQRAYSASRGSGRTGHSGGRTASNGTEASEKTAAKKSAGIVCFSFYCSSSLGFRWPAA